MDNGAGEPPPAERGSRRSYALLVVAVVGTVAVAAGAVSGLRWWNGAGSRAAGAARTVDGDPRPECRVAAGGEPVEPRRTEPSKVDVNVRGTVLSATSADGAVVLNVDADGDPVPAPTHVLGLDPTTLARTWTWTYPAGGGYAGNDFGGNDPAGAYPTGGDGYLLVAGDTALTVVGTRTGRPVVLAIDTATGAERWRLPAPELVSPSLAYADRCVVVIALRSTTGRAVASRGLHAVDPHTGATLWQGAGSTDLTCMSLGPPWLYVLRGTGFARVNARTGEVRTAAGAAPAAADTCTFNAVTGDRVVDARTGRWYSVDWAGGRVTADDDVGPAGAPVDSASCTVVGDVVAVVRGDLTVHSRRSGAELWNSDPSPGEFLPLPAQASDTLLFRTPRVEPPDTPASHLTAVEAATGRVVWHSEAMPGDSGGIAWDGRTRTVFLETVAPDATSRTWALDARDGMPMWVVAGTPVPGAVTGGWLFVRGGARTAAYRVVAA